MSKYYNIDKVKKIADDKHSNFIFIYGGKSKGKSYQAKIKLMLKEYIKTGKRFVLLRRYEDEITKGKVEMYFSDINRNGEILEMTNGVYNSVTKKAEKIYFSFIKDGKIVKNLHIGYAIALTVEQNFSSILSNKDISNIIFEEFQSRTRYLTDECEKLDFLYSTIDREQGTTKLWFMGNAISKSCPYWEHFGIFDIIKKQKSGTIETYKKDGHIITIEKTPVFNTKKTTVGATASAISAGDWYATKQPKIKMRGHKRGLLYINFDFNNLLFLGELNIDAEGSPYWFIREVEFFKDTKNTFTVSNNIKSDYRYSMSIYNFRNEKLNRITSDTFRLDKLFFSSDEVGTDFLQSCTFHIKK